MSAPHSWEVISSVRFTNALVHFQDGVCECAVALKTTAAGNECTQAKDQFKTIPCQRRCLGGTFSLLIEAQVAPLSFAYSGLFSMSPASPRRLVKEVLGGTQRQAHSRGFVSSQINIVGTIRYCLRGKGALEGLAGLACQIFSSG